jgi:GT2 family glycosyltransferase
VNSPETVVVIVNWNGERFLEGCLRSVFAQVYTDFKVVFVDNGSTDGSVAFVRKNFPQVDIIALDKNYGFARANNIAIKKALENGAEYIALLNNDTKVEKNWLGELAETMRAGMRVGICASKMLRMDNPGILDSTGHIFIDGIIYGRGGEEPDKGQYDRQLDVAGACAGACLYRKKMLETIGLFDESFGSYYEDVELSWRAHKAGWKAKYVPGAVVYHKRYGSSKGNEELQKQIGTQGKLNLVKTIRRHASFAGKLRITAIWIKEAARQRVESRFSGKAIEPDYLEMLRSLWFKKE